MSSNAHNTYKSRFIQLLISRSSRAVWIFCIALGALLALWFQFDKKMRSELCYYSNKNNQKFIVYVKMDFLSIVTSYFTEETTYVKIVKIAIIEDSRRYEFVPTGREILSEDNHFLFKNIDFHDDLGSDLGIIIPVDSKNIIFVKMKHANSAEFPTLYFFVSDVRSNTYEKLVVSWP